MDYKRKCVRKNSLTQYKLITINYKNTTQFSEATSTFEAIRIL